jgi:hypothetical protein
MKYEVRFSGYADSEDAVLAFLNLIETTKADWYKPTGNEPLDMVLEAYVCKNKHEDGEQCTDFIYVDFNKPTVVHKNSDGKEVTYKSFDKTIRTIS